MSNGNGHRWSKFWWRDHQGDAALRMCSLAARGLWVELLCLAHEATPVGHVLVNGRAPTIPQIAAITGAQAKEVERLIAELEAAGVFSRTDDGTIYSRRMVKDAASSDAGRDFVARRWSDKSQPPPNRGANRSPTSKPNGEAKSHPTSEPITKTSEARVKNLSNFLEEGEETCAREPAPPTEGRLGRTVVDLAKALKTKPPPFTPSVAFQQSALEPAPRRPQPQDMPMTPEEQLAALHKMMAEEAKRA